MMKWGLLTRGKAGRVLVLMLVLCLSAVFSWPGVPLLAAAGSKLSLGSIELDPGAEGIVQLKVENIAGAGLAGYDILISFNSGIAALEVQTGPADFAAPVANAVGGGLHLAAAQALGKTGSFVLASLKVKAIGQAGQTTPVYLTARLVGADLQDIPGIVQNGTISIKGAANSGGSGSGGGQGGSGAAPGGGTAPAGPGGLDGGAPGLPGNGQASPARSCFAGKDRYDTALAIAEGAYPGPGQKRVLVANAYAPADALAGAPLAYKYRAPILLAPLQAGGAESLKTYLDKAMESQGMVTLLGGTGVLDSSYQGSLGRSAERIGGRNREETAVQIARELVGGQTGTPAVVVNSSGFADAISIAPFAAQMGWPILLTAGDALSQATAEYLAVEKPSRIIVVGGPGVVTEAVYNALAALSRSVERVWGPDRFATNAAVLKEFGGQAAKIAFASGDGEYPIDALAGAALGIPIVLVHDRQNLSADQKEYLQGLGEKPILVFGGTGVIDQEISGK